MNVSRRPVVVAIVLAGCAVAQAFGRFTFTLLLPAVKQELLNGYGIAGSIGSLNVGGYLIGTLSVALLATRVRPIVLFRVGLLLVTLGLLTLGTAHSVAQLLVGMAFAGIGGAWVYLPSPALVASVFPPERRGFAVGITAAGIGVGFLVASGLTSGLRASSDRSNAWRPIWFVESLVGVVVTALAWLVLRAQVASSGSPPRLSALRHVPGWKFVTGAYAVYGLAYVLVMAFLVALVEQQAGFSPSHASALFAVVGVGLTIGGMGFGPLSDRLGRRTTLVGAYLLGGSCSALVLVGAEPWVALACLGFGAAFGGAVILKAAHIGDHAPPQDLSGAFATLTLAFGTMQTIGPQLGGLIRDRTGSFTPVYLLAVALWFIGAALLSRLPTGATPGGQFAGQPTPDRQPAR